MLLSLRFWVVALLLTLPIFSFAQVTATGSQYRLAPGDIIKITVFGEPDLSIEEVRLNDAGAFSYPFLGEIVALQLTPAELEARVIDGLEGDFLINPKVTVSVLSYREFFINGEVRNAGAFPWQPGLTLRQAVAMAGGLTERASQRRMNVVRGGDTSQTPERINMDAPIQPGDIITIDQGFF